jgi:acetyl esterase/lipase
MKLPSFTKLLPIPQLTAVMLSLVCFSSVMADDSPSALDSDPKGWIDFMPPSDLKGWTRIAIPPKNPLGREQWHLDTSGQMLICDGDGGHEMLRYDKELTNCIFHVECRYIPVTNGKTNYNSGIFIRNSADGDIWHQCQLTMDGGYLFGVTPDGDKTKHFKSPASEKRMKAPGEWNTAEVTAQGNTLSVWLNGAEVSRFAECGMPTGYIALESEGYAIEFRNLKLKELPATAQDAAGKPQASTSPKEFHDLAYIPNGTDRQKLDLYLPEPSDSPSPLIVWIHGGGWQAGNKDNCLSKRFVPKGYAAASVGYRLSQQATYPAQIQDCKAAIRWLRAHAAEYHLDPKRVGVWGLSAGGHLVALLGTTGNTRDFDVGENLDQSSAVQCVVDWFGPTDFLYHTDPKIEQLLGVPVAGHEDVAKHASPLYFVTKESAPFLIMHGDKDPLVPIEESKAFNDALKKEGVESTLIVLPGAGHYGPDFGKPEITKIVGDFFDTHLLSKPAH